MGVFSEMQFGFQEGMGRSEASFTILGTIYHILERGSKISAVFSMFAKPLTQSGLMTFFTNYFRNLLSEVGCGWP